MRFAAFKPDTKYRLRVRLRAETVGDGEAFWAGIERGGPGTSKKTSEVSCDYAWYDVAVWKPNAGQYFWIGPGRFTKGKSAIKALYIDKIDFALADAPEPIKWSGGTWDETGALRLRLPQAPQQGAFGFREIKRGRTQGNGRRKTDEAFVIRTVPLRCHVRHCRFVCI